MVKSKKVFSPQEFVELMTGKTVCFSKDDTVAEIEAVLNSSIVEELWNYPLDEIAHIVEDDLNVVLVDVSGHNKDGEWVNEWRWFEVTEDFSEDTEDAADAVVTTICYGERQEWKSREEAKAYFLEGMMASEGSEQNRYTTIYGQLCEGLAVCADEDYMERKRSRKALYTIKSVSDEGTYYLVRDWRANKAIWVEESKLTEQMLFKTVGGAKRSLNRLLEAMPEYATDTFTVARF